MNCSAPHWQSQVAICTALSGGPLCEARCDDKSCCFDLAGWGVSGDEGRALKDQQTCSQNRRALVAVPWGGFDGKYWGRDLTNRGSYWEPGNLPGGEVLARDGGNSVQKAANRTLLIKGASIWAGMLWLSSAKGPVSHTWNLLLAEPRATFLLIFCISSSELATNQFVFSALLLYLSTPIFSFVLYHLNFLFSFFLSRKDYKN